MMDVSAYLRRIDEACRFLRLFLKVTVAMKTKQVYSAVYYTKTITITIMVQLYFKINYLCVSQVLYNTE